jgi:chromosome segregation ATPase
MDPDTSKKVTDLLGIMEGMSSDIDIKAELDAFTSRIVSLEQKVEELAQRLDRMEKTGREKQEVLKALRRELKNLFPSGA